MSNPITDENKALRHLLNTVFITIAVKYNQPAFDAIELRLVAALQNPAPEAGISAETQRQAFEIFNELRRLLKLSPPPGGSLKKGPQHCA